MHVHDAIEWVNIHKGLIFKKSAMYTNFTPYDKIDYLQDAYEASVKAALCCQRNPTIKFEACFYRIWRDLVASVTPFPDEAREACKKKKEAFKALKEGRPIPEVNDEQNTKRKPYYSGGTSMSFPTSAFRDIPLEAIQSKARKKKPIIDIEKVYEQRVKPLLSAKEAQAMELSLGITREGQLSLNEIALKKGITKDTAKEYIARARSKAHIHAKSRGKRHAA